MGLLSEKPFGLRGVGRKVCGRCLHHRAYNPSALPSRDLYRNLILSSDNILQNPLVEIWIVEIQNIKIIIACF
jgi:hypothetical protein